MAFLIGVLTVVLFFACIMLISHMQETRDDSFIPLVVFTGILGILSTVWLYNNLTGPNFPYDEVRQYELELVERDGVIYAQNYKKHEILNVLTTFGQIPPKGSKVVAKYRSGGWYKGIYTFPEERPTYFLEKPDAEKR